MTNYPYHVMPYAGSPSQVDSAPARGGPTLDDGSTSGTSRLYRVGPPLAGGLRCRVV